VAPTDLLIRPADRSDGKQLASVHLSARRAAAMPPPAHTDDAVRCWLDGRLQSTDEIWVAEVGGAVAAYSRMSDTWLDDLYVAPPFAGCGVGSALLEVAKQQRPAGFCLWVFEVNIGARRFYGQHGLVELERTDGSANEEKSPDVRMAWPGSDPLAFYRTLIDDVDGQLGDLLARRAALTRAVQVHKTVPGRDPDRERAIAEALAVRAPALGPERLHRILEAIITESLDAARHGPG